MIAGLPVDKWIALFLTLTSFPMAPSTGSEKAVPSERDVPFAKRAILSQEIPSVEGSLVQGMVGRLEAERNAHIAFARSA